MDELEQRVRGMPRGTSIRLLMSAADDLRPGWSYFEEGIYLLSCTIPPHQARQLSVPHPVTDTPIFNYRVTIADARSHRVALEHVVVIISPGDCMNIHNGTIRTVVVRALLELDRPHLSGLIVRASETAHAPFALIAKAGHTYEVKSFKQNDNPPVNGEYPNMQTIQGEENIVKYVEIRSRTCKWLRGPFFAGNMFTDEIPCSTFLLRVQR